MLRRVVLFARFEHIRGGVRCLVHEITSALSEKLISNAFSPFMQYDLIVIRASTEREEAKRNYKTLRALEDGKQQRTTQEYYVFH
jgi:hypothetical protein